MLSMGCTLAEHGDQDEAIPYAYTSYSVSKDDPGSAGGIVVVAQKPQAKCAHVPDVLCSSSLRLFLYRFRQGDEELQTLASLPRFLPILKSSLGVGTPDGETSFDHLEPAPYINLLSLVEVCLLVLCCGVRLMIALTWQYHMRVTSVRVFDEQHRLTMDIKSVDQLAQRLCIPCVL